MATTSSLKLRAPPEELIEGCHKGGNPCRGGVALGAELTCAHSTRNAATLAVCETLSSALAPDGKHQRAVGRWVAGAGALQGILNTPVNGWDGQTATESA